MAENVSELNIEILGTATSLDKMLESAGQSLNAFATRVDNLGVKISGGLTSALETVGKMAGAIETSLSVASGSFQEIGAAASTAGKETEGAANAMQTAGQMARGAEASVQLLASALTTIGNSANKGASATLSAMNRINAALNNTRQIASRPIVQKVATQQTGAGRRGGSERGASTAGYAIAGVGAALLTSEADLVKQGESVEDELRKLYATAGETTNFEVLRKEVLSIGEQFGILPVEVAKALYPITSLGFKGADGLKVLTASANMAKGSQADLGVVADLISKTLNAYGYNADHAGRLTDEFTRAIKDGVVPGKQFVDAYAGVLTISKNAGLQVDDTSAALAVLTHNAKSAAIGGTQLRAFISGIIAPTKAMRDAAKAAGLEWLATGHGADELKRVGLSGTLAEISKATNGNVTALTTLFPDLRKFSAGLALLNNGGVVFTRTLKDVKNSVGATSAASREMDKSLAQSGRNLGAAFQAAGSNLETALKPILTSLFTGLANLINWFNRLPDGAQKAIGVFAAVAGAAAVLVGGLLVLAPGIAAVGGLLAGIGPEVLIVAGVLAVLAAGAALLAAAWIRDWGHIREGVASVLGWAQPYIRQFAGAVQRDWGALTQNLAAYWKSVSPQVMQVLTDLQGGMRLWVTATESLWQTFGQALWADVRIAWDGITGVFSAALTLIEGYLRLTLDALTGNWQKFWADAKDTATTLGAGLKDTVHNIWGDMEDGFKKTLDSMQAYWGAFWDKLKSGAGLQGAIDAGNAAAAKAHGGQLPGQQTPAWDNPNVKAAYSIAQEQDKIRAEIAALKTARAQIAPDAPGHADALKANTAATAALTASLKALEADRQKQIAAIPAGGAAGVHSDNRLVEAMAKHVGEATGIQCGRAVSIAMSESGFGGSATALAKAALANPNKQIQPDYNGNFPPGTIIYFPDKRHPDTISGTGQQHFVVAGDIDKDNHQRMAESTTAGGQGRHYRYDRTFGQIASEHDGRFLAFNPSGATVSTSNMATGADNAEPQWAKDFHDKTKQKHPGIGGTLTDIPLKHLAALMPDDLGKAATNAQTYEAKLQSLNDKLAEHTLRLSEAGKGYDKYGVEVAAIAARLTLADNAIHNTDTAMAGLTPKVTADEKAVNAARLAFNAFADRMKAQKGRGEAYTPAETKEYAALHDSYTKARGLYEADNGALKDNQRVHAQATQNKIADLAALTAAQQRQMGTETEAFLKEQEHALKRGEMSRDAYDAALKARMAKLAPGSSERARVGDALETSQDARAGANRELTLKTLRLDHKDFDALREELAEETALYAQAGASAEAIADYTSKKLAEIHRAEFESARKDADDLQKTNLDLGRETEADYRHYLIGTLQAVAGEYGATSVEVAKLKLEIEKIDWAAAGEQADGFKVELENGKIGIDEYILRLKDLQKNLLAEGGVKSPEYKKVSDDVQAATVKINSEAKAGADAVGGKFADAFMQIAHHAKTLKQVVGDALKDATDAALHNFIAQAISKVALKITQKSDADKMAAAIKTHKPIVDKFADGITIFKDTATTFVGGVQAFGQQVTAFVQAANSQMANAGGGSGFGGGAGIGASGGFGGGDSGSNSGFGGTASAIEGAAGGASSGGDAGAMLGALNGSGQGGNVGAVAASVLPDLQSGNDASAVESGLSTAASAGVFGASAAAAVPWIGVAMAAVSLLGMLGPHKHTPTSLQPERYAPALSSFSSTIDSGYSGADGLRTLLGGVTAQAAGVNQQYQNNPNQGKMVVHAPQVTITIAAGAFTGLGVDPQAHGNAVLQAISSGLAQATALDNASRPRS